MSDEGSAARPIIAKMSREDLTEALSAGWRDLKAALPYSLFFGAIYALGGALLAALLFATNVHIAVYPLATGFALIAPFVAAGTYQISRRLERGEPLSWGAILALHNGSQELGWMALLTLFALVIWLDIALILYLLFFGGHVLTLDELMTAIATTPAGALFFVVGNLAGACIALTLFALTAISCPMLIDRDVDAITAIITSVETVRKNASQMLAWAILIAFLLAVSILCFFVGLIVVLPLLGHTTWHLYRKLVSFPVPGEQRVSAAAGASETHLAA